jgi:uncharacterized protein
MANPENAYNVPRAFDAAAARRLQSFLDAPDRAPETMRLNELKGFLFAIATAPELVQPSGWLPIVFGGEMPKWKSLDEAKSILNALMALYNKINTDVIEGRPRLPASCKARPITFDNFGPEAPLGQWARGFSTGFSFLGPAWNDAKLEGEEDALVGACVATLSFFADRKLAEKLHKDRVDPSVSFFEHAVLCQARINGAMRALADVGRALYLDAMDTHRPPPPQKPILRTVPKVGRNDPCPCGSGKKFKHCCGAPGTRH